MNKWLGSGKVSQDPTIKYNEDKVSFVAFTMMCNCVIKPNVNDCVSIKNEFYKVI